MKTYRQGDILLKEIEKLPSGLKDKNNILALGEATGHKHFIENGKVMVDTKGNQYVVAGQETQLIHDEHAVQKIPIGIYAMIQQREYDISEGARQVMD